MGMVLLYPPHTLPIAILSGLMFYYGLDFHDLAPNSFLNILTFIFV